MSTKRERDKARREFEQKQKERRSIEAQIAELEKQPGGLSDAQLEELFPELVVLPIPPATKFLIERLKGDDPQFDSKWKLAVIDLVDSDVPLDRHTRSKIAGELRRLYFPNAARDRRAKLRNELAMIEDQKHCLLNRGMTVAEAEREIAATLGLASVGALRKRIQRARICGTKN